MKIDDRFEIVLLVANLVSEDEFVVDGDIYDDFREMRCEHPESSYEYGYGLIDTETGFIAEGAEDWYSSPDAALAAYNRLFGPFAIAASDPGKCEETIDLFQGNDAPAPGNCEEIIELLQEDASSHNECEEVIDLLQDTRILSAQECWNGQKNRTDFVTACDGVMKAILKARDNGKRECLFDPRPVQQEAVVKAEFLRKGYSFRPYGYSGGVWQDAEMICW